VSGEQGAVEGQQSADSSQQLEGILDAWAFIETKGEGIPGFGLRQYRLESLCHRGICEEVRK
jgi:hypothetical protein